MRNYSSSEKRWLPAILVLCILASLPFLIWAYGRKQAETVTVAVPTFETNDIKEIMTWLKNSGFRARAVMEGDPFDFDAYDALVIPGGGDVDASLYGQENHSENYYINIDYDKFEIDLVRRFAEAGKPVLGICRGQQLINVAFGGTLVQDIPVLHDYYREVRQDPSAFLYDLEGETILPYHNHHQCIDRLGEGLTADAWDVQDGTIEGIHHESLPVYGVQYHPELKHNLNTLAEPAGKAFMEICLEACAGEDGKD